MGMVIYSDAILVPLSLFLTMGYHAYLLQYYFRNNPTLATTGVDAIRRRMWVLSIKEDNQKKSMLAVQSSRNSLMATILGAAIAVALNSSLAALTNNTYNAAHLFNSTLLGLHSGQALVLKYGLASILLLSSFLCSSMALGCLTDANFLVSVPNGLSPEHLQAMFDRGFILAFIGNRALYATFPLLLWLFGPIAVALSSMALIWVLYELDFGGNGVKVNLPRTSPACNVKLLSEVC
ncbi:PREDICTED: uncharacterized protein LOC104593758 [Nelumbo nucifera]|uniref:Uncharacterized protein LOC104593758 n=2 Tax=Nelumbo nucifera TaxID=4432 RepID=A0A1U7ZK67_NELNU|nr:PREDICTED: uncharacterized protein LOC104593758 [Nelumbo nucifera]DAD38610.1 TPA_asm: hypothetical protein HUJ06_012932 [Nelumbo nucifera]